MESHEVRLEVSRVQEDLGRPEGGPPGTGQRLETSRPRRPVGLGAAAEVVGDVPGGPVAYGLLRPARRLPDAVVTEGK